MPRPALVAAERTFPRCARGVAAQEGEMKRMVEEAATGLGGLTGLI